VVEQVQLEVYLILMEVAEVEQEVLENHLEQLLVVTQLLL
tara:strand:+ start:21 stop:140 length:120 start_codon:yes stop_codon:yes gene_type:complete